MGNLQKWKGEVYSDCVKQIASWIYQCKEHLKVHNWCIQYPVEIFFGEAE